MSITNRMTHLARLETVFAGGRADRTPCLGGWIACVDHIRALTKTTVDEFWANPLDITIHAYEILGVDGLIEAYVPLRWDGYRFVDPEHFARAQGTLSLPEALTKIDAMPSADRILAEFDFEGAYTTYRARLLERQARCGDMVWMPANWDAGAKIEWWAEFGYENFFEIFGAYPQHAHKLLDAGGAQGHCQSRLIARAVREGLYPHAVLLGEDICTQRGPMISPRYLERYWAPQLRFGLQPLLDVGCRPVWHCDGDVRPILDMLLDCGVQGFQGFQEECGVTVELISRKRTREGTPVLIFGPLSVTTELRTLTPAGVHQRVHEVIDICRGNADLVLFTSSTMNPDVPLDNVIAFYEAVHTS